MPRRLALPGASELFRGTEAAEAAPLKAVPAVAATPPSAAPEASGRASGRVRHDEKITVYVSVEELIAIEHARLRLRAAGVAVDRGRLVRAAISAALADLAEHGADAPVVARLGAQEA